MTDSDPSRPALRACCHGLPPLAGILPDWLPAVLASRVPFELVEQYGSPVHLHSTAPFVRNLTDISRAIRQAGPEHRVYFARKANKCLSYVDAALAAGAGVDTASLNELHQTLERGAGCDDVIVTAAVKNRHLMRESVANGVVVSIDNQDEWAVAEECATPEHPACVMLRLSGFVHDGVALPSRFGFRLADTLLTGDAFRSDRVRVVGLHFHLDGYDAGQRVSAIRQILPLIPVLRGGGHPLRFLDIGGGFPSCYLESEHEWRTFWSVLHAAARGEAPPVTFGNDTYGRTATDDGWSGSLKMYPYWQSPTGAEWLSGLLASRTDEANSESLGGALARLDVELRCEPGRNLLMGCGATIARVEFTKPAPDGDLFVGVEMNRTQCRTTSADFLVDPLVLPAPDRDEFHSATGVLVGTYCMESELLTTRRLHFPQGIARGDLVVFPNTAGYLMHFLESRSHQFPLATNLVQDAADPLLFRPDPIEAV